MYNITYHRISYFKYENIEWVRKIKSRKLQRARHVAGVGDQRNTCKVLVASLAISIGEITQV